MSAGTTSRCRLLLADCAAPNVAALEALPQPLACLAVAGQVGLARLRCTLVHSAAAAVHDDIRGGGVQPPSLRRACGSGPTRL